MTIELDEELPQEELPLAAEGEDTPEAEVVEAEPVDEGEQTAIVEAGSLELESLSKLATQDQIEAAVTRALARIDATQRFKVALLSMTNFRDWYAHGAAGDNDGIPYLAESGSEKVIHAFQIEVEHDGGVRENHQDGTYEYVYNGRMRALQFSDIWYPITGSRWSGDGFFTRGGKRRADPGDVRKSALTNFYNRGIKTVCGLRTITWEELEAIPHLSNLRTRVTKIGYTSDDEKAQEATPGARSEIAAGPHIIIKLAYGDEKNKAAIKKLRPWNWNAAAKVWEVGWSKENFARILDLHAADSNAVRFKVVDVPESELPK